MAPLYTNCKNALEAVAKPLALKGPDRKSVGNAHGLAPMGTPDPQGVELGPANRVTSVRAARSIACPRKGLLLDFIYLFHFSQLQTFYPACFFAKIS